MSFYALLLENSGVFKKENRNLGRGWLNVTQHFGKKYY